MLFCLQCNPHAILHAVIEGAWRRPYSPCMSLHTEPTLILPEVVCCPDTNARFLLDSSEISTHLASFCWDVRWWHSPVAQITSIHDQPARNQCHNRNESLTLFQNTPKWSLVILWLATACRDGNVNRIDQNHWIMVATWHSCIKKKKSIFSLGGAKQRQI